jgi:hypothetical protein
MGGMEESRFSAEDTTSRQFWSLLATSVSCPFVANLPPTEARWSHLWEGCFRNLVWSRNVRKEMMNVKTFTTYIHTWHLNSRPVSPLLFQACRWEWLKWHSLVWESYGKHVENGTLMSFSTNGRKKECSTIYMKLFLGEKFKISTSLR